MIRQFCFSVTVKPATPEPRQQLSSPPSSASVSGTAPFRLGYDTGPFNVQPRSPKSSPGRCREQGDGAEQLSESPGLNAMLGTKFESEGGEKTHNEEDVSECSKNMPSKLKLKGKSTKKGKHITEDSKVKQTSPKVNNSIIIEDDSQLTLTISEEVISGTTDASKESKAPILTIPDTEKLVPGSQTTRRNRSTACTIESPSTQASSVVPIVDWGCRSRPVFQIPASVTTPNETSSGAGMECERSTEESVSLLVDGEDRHVNETVVNGDRIRQDIQEEPTERNQNQEETVKDYKETVESEKEAVESENDQRECVPIPHTNEKNQKNVSKKNKSKEHAEKDGRMKMKTESDQTEHEVIPEPLKERSNNSAANIEIPDKSKKSLTQEKDPDKDIEFQESPQVIAETLESVKTEKADAVQCSENRQDVELPDIKQEPMLVANGGEPPSDDEKEEKKPNLFRSLKQELVEISSDEETLMQGLKRRKYLLDDSSSEEEQEEKRTKKNADTPLKRRSRRRPRPIKSDSESDQASKVKRKKGKQKDFKSKPIESDSESECKKTRKRPSRTKQINSESDSEPDQSKNKRKKTSKTKSIGSDSDSEPGKTRKSKQNNLHRMKPQQPESDSNSKPDMAKKTSRKPMKKPEKPKQDSSSDSSDNDVPRQRQHSGRRAVRGLARLGALSAQTPSLIVPNSGVGTVEPSPTCIPDSIQPASRSKSFVSKKEENSPKKCTDTDSSDSDELPDIGLSVKPQNIGTDSDGIKSHEGAKSQLNEGMKSQLNQGVKSQLSEGKSQLSESLLSSRPSPYASSRPLFKSPRTPRLNLSTLKGIESPRNPVVSPESVNGTLNSEVELQAAVIIKVCKKIVTMVCFRFIPNEKLYLTRFYLLICRQSLFCYC